jgi:hypothetical protein
MTDAIKREVMVEKGLARAELGYVISELERLDKYLDGGFEEFVYSPRDLNNVLSRLGNVQAKMSKAYGLAVAVDYQKE